MLLDEPPPSSAQCLRVLKDGYWEETAVYVEGNDAPRVRKSSRASAADRPWALETLRREIQYLTELQEDAKALFPPVKRAWITESGAGYEIAYLSAYEDVARRIAGGTAEHADAFQQVLAETLFHTLYHPCESVDSLAKHVWKTFVHTTEQLRNLAGFHAMITADTVEVNARPSPGLEGLLREIAEKKILERLDGATSVRLHGDLILENILVPAREDDWWKRLTFIDPVSVAGIAAGPPLFDLVKYVSYASGELLAIRSETCAASVDGERGSFAWSHEDPLLRPYAEGAWYRLFQQAYEAHHGPIDWPLYHVLDAYFSLVMAVNTEGKQQRARVLKALLALRLVLA